MPIGDISLSASARSNLLSLQSTEKLLGTTQGRLASGNKVNSALDGATAFFASQGFLNRANDLSGLKDGLGTALQTVKSASDAITSITSVITQLQGITNSALQTTDTTTRTTLAGQYNSLLSQINGLVTDSVFNGTNLLTSTGITLQVFFNATNSTSLTITGVNVNATGLGVVTAANDFATSSDIQVAQSLLQTALTTLRTNSSSFGNNTTVINTRTAFTDNLINTLQQASDNLKLADVNQEGANLQALQARSSLGIVALGISGTQAQAILRLF